MATSGTVGATQVDALALVEHAFRHCGKLPSTISGELLGAAKEGLFFVLTALVNDGVSLWCIEQACIPTVAGTATYSLPLGTCDLLRANFRYQYTALTGGTISGAGYSGVSFTTATIVNNVQVSFLTTGTPQLVVEYSQDNVTWTQAAAFYTQQSPLPSGQALAQDVVNAVPALYWRIRDTSGTLLGVATLQWSNNPTEIQMSAYNRDDYFQLPNKTFQSLNSLQYWFDKQIAPRMWVWPVPQSSTAQIAVEVHRQIQDVGALTNTIEMPQRWYMYIIYALAEYVGSLLPRGELEPGKLEYLSGRKLEEQNRAIDGESDGAPIKLQPVMRGYTT